MSEILVVSSCTGRKTRAPEDPIAVPAGDLYSGQHHRRLMAGVRAYRAAGEPAGSIRIEIVSAGLGLLGEWSFVRSYDETFNGMKTKQIDERAAALGIPDAVGSLLAQPRLLTVVALGAQYLRACAIGAVTSLGSPLLVLCGRQGVRTLPIAQSVIPVVLTEADTRRFGAGHVALKGAVVAHLLNELISTPTLVADPSGLVTRMRTPAATKVSPGRG